MILTRCKALWRREVVRCSRHDCGRSQTTPAVGAAVDRGRLLSRNLSLALEGLGGISARRIRRLALYRHCDLLHDHPGNLFHIASPAGYRSLSLLSRRSVLMLQLLPDGTSRTITIGPDLPMDSNRKWLSEAHVWQGCKLAPGGKFALMGTTMSQGSTTLTMRPQTACN